MNNDFHQQNGNMVNQTGNAYVLGTTNVSVENSTQNIGVSTTESYTKVPYSACANEQLEMAIWRVSFAVTTAPRAHVLE